MGKAHSDERGVLAPVTALDRWLHVVLVVLTIVSAIRYADRHGLDAAGLFILIGATCFVALYVMRPLLPAVPWILGVVALWAALTLIAPSFAWTAVPVAFAILKVLPFGVAAALVVVVTGVVTVAWLRIIEVFDPTIVVGPIGIALVTVIAFRTLQQEAIKRQHLLDDLTAAQAELAAAQRLSGALTERTRLSREIHDSVAQGLSSINLLLQAAEQDWSRKPDAARAHVHTAAATARDSLDEVRRVVRDLAPAGLDDDETGAGLQATIQAVIDRESHGLTSQFRVHGTPVPVGAPTGSAIVRTLRGALANVVEHAAASRVDVTLTYQGDEVLLDIRDDGAGFDPAMVPGDAERGRGLRGIAQRAAELGGRSTVESELGEGTTISLALPLNSPAKDMP